MNAIKAHRMNRAGNQQQEEDATVKDFLASLKGANLVDVFQVAGMAKAWKDTRLDNASDILLFLPRGSPSDEMCNLERMLYDIFLKGRFDSVKKVIVESPLDSSLRGDSPDVNAVVHFEEVDEDSILTEFASGSTQSSSSRTVDYCRDHFDGYLRLLVNSRDELALARVLSGPLGPLSQVAFTSIRREAEKTSMPMYQMALSYVQRVKLGGKVRKSLIII